MKACRSFWQGHGDELVSMQQSMIISAIAHSLGTSMKVML